MKMDDVQLAIFNIGETFNELSNLERRLKGVDIKAINTGFDTLSKFQFTGNLKNIVKSVKELPDLLDAITSINFKGINGTRAKQLDILVSIFDQLYTVLNYIGFLSSGNSHILFRDVTDTHKDAWVKYPIDKESSKNKVWYGLACEVDIFTEDDITINLCEGVMDIIGIKSHLGMSGTNIMNIAVTGQNYNSLILHLIAIGLVGGNVTLNIFSDNYKVYSDNNNKASTEKFHRKYLERYKPLYKNINLYYNMKSKDYGVKKEEIALRKIQI